MARSIGLGHDVAFPVCSFSHMIYMFTPGLATLNLYADSSKSDRPSISSEYTEGCYRDHPAGQEVPHKSLAARIVPRNCSTKGA